MEHPDEGTIRRALDEPQAVDAAVHAHIETCAGCGAIAQALRTRAAAVDEMIGGDAPAADPRAALRAVRARAARPAAGMPLLRPMAGVAAAAAFVVALVFTPLGGYARSFLTIFQPRQFQPITISREDIRQLRLLPHADDVGYQRVVSKPTEHRYASLAQAQAHVSFALLQPARVPAGFDAKREFATVSPAELTFTFSAAKAAAFERRSHKRLPAMPQGLDGTTVRVQTGEAFHMSYMQRGARKHDEDAEDHMESLTVIEARPPKVSSTSASLDTLERYLLAMPDVPRDLADRIRALSDIENTVPVPVVIDKQTARPVTVQGASGLAIGDNTGIGAGVMWQKNGVIYIVAGPLRMDDVLSIANGLH